MSKMTAPIGRSAEQVEVWFDNEKLDHVQKRLVSEEEITAAVQMIQDRMTFERPPSHTRQ
jgi:hypothetical protein